MQIFRQHHRPTESELWGAAQKFMVQQALQVISAVAKAEEPLHRGCLVEGLCNGKGAYFDSVLSVVLSKTIGDLLIPLV